MNKRLCNRNSCTDKTYEESSGLRIQRMPWRQDNVGRLAREALGGRGTRSRKFVALDSILFSAAISNTSKSSSSYHLWIFVSNQLLFSFPLASLQIIPSENSFSNERIPSFITAGQEKMKRPSDKPTLQAHVCSIKQERGMPLSVAFKSCLKRINKCCPCLSVQFKTLEITTNAEFLFLKNAYRLLRASFRDTELGIFTSVSTFAFWTNGHDLGAEKCPAKVELVPSTAPLPSPLLCYVLCVVSNSSGFSTVTDHTGSTSSGTATSLWFIPYKLSLNSGFSHSAWVPWGSEVSLLKGGQLNFDKASEWK